METTKKSDIVFNLTAFKLRARRVAKKQGRAYATLSKDLFNGNSAALVNILDPRIPDDKKKLPQLSTLFRAERTLADLEKKLGLVEA